MTRYRVTVEAIVSLETVVEAHDEDEARERADFENGLYRTRSGGLEPSTGFDLLWMGRDSIQWHEMCVEVDDGE